MIYSEKQFEKRFERGVKINENTFHSYIENATSSFSKYSLKKIYEEYEKMMKLEIPDF